MSGHKNTDQNVDQNVPTKCRKIISASGRFCPGMSQPNITLNPFQIQWCLSVLHSVGIAFSTISFVQKRNRLTILSQRKLSCRLADLLTKGPTFTITTRLDVRQIKRRAGVCVDAQKTISCLYTTYVCCCCCFHWKFCSLPPFMKITFFQTFCVKFSIQSISFWNDNGNDQREWDMRVCEELWFVKGDVLSKPAPRLRTVIAFVRKRFRCVTRVARAIHRFSHCTDCEILFLAHPFAGRDNPTINNFKSSA